MICIVWMQENPERLQVYHEKCECFVNTEKFTEFLVFKFHRRQI